MSAVVAVILCAALQLLFCIILWCNKKNWKNEGFVKKFDSLISELKHDEKSQKGGAIVWILAYFVRRVTLSLSLVYFDTFSWAQIALQFASSTFGVIFLSWARPLSSVQANRLETLNEVSTWVLLYCLISFTAFQPDVEVRNEMGYFVISLVVAHTCIYLFLIGQKSFVGMRTKLRNKVAKNQENKCAICLLKVISCS